LPDQNNIWKFLQQQLTEEESSSVQEWINLSKSNAREYDEIRVIWEECNKLDDVHVFDPLESWSKIEEEISQSGKSKTILIRWIGIAASLLFVSSMIMWFYLGKEGLYESYVAENQETSIQLADGSNIHLKKGATIKYFTRIDKDFKNRTVFISGKIRFDIAPDSQLPFIVEAGKTGIKVLGTIFDVEILDTNNVSVENIEGLIKFYELQDEENAITLKQGEKFIFDGSAFIEKTKKQVEPQPGENMTVEQLLGILFKKFDGKFNTGPYGKFDIKDTLRIDLHQSLENIISQLDSNATIQYRKTCSDCYELNSLTLSN
jgi:ferric-dicitrate binding protein FerR (iron transport regulator)